MLFMEIWTRELDKKNETTKSFTESKEVCIRLAANRLDLTFPTENEAQKLQEDFPLMVEDFYKGPEPLPYRTQVGTMFSIRFPIKGVHSQDYIASFASTLELELKEKGYKLFQYLFCWEEVPGNDSGRFIEFLIQNFDINWVREAKIDKINDGMTIKVHSENDSLLLKLNNEKTKAMLTIDDVKIDEFNVMPEKDKLKICKI